MDTWSNEQVKLDFSKAIIEAKMIDVVKEELNEGEGESLHHILVTWEEDRN